jgi:2-polyprenyl-3-methyl-5-hydroxy-6-metoxy-1,4-benzoquinol methylase
MNLIEIFQDKVSNNSLILEQANIAILEIKKSIIQEYVGLQYIPGVPSSIEVDVPKDVLERLFQRIRNQWTSLGAREPYMSVLSAEKYLMKNIGDNLLEFKESGNLEVSRLSLLAEKNNLNLNRKTCLELGCGVGRMTAYLASSFEKVVAYDISPGNISIAKKYLADLGHSNVEFHLIESIDEFSGNKSADVFVSFMVLQHNPPPLQKYFLENILRNLNPGGVCYFQTVTHAPTYRYSAEANFSYEAESEMHCLPMSNVLKIIQENQLVVVDVIKDGGGHNHDSNSFFGVKPNPLRAQFLNSARPA